MVTSVDGGASAWENMAGHFADVEAAGADVIWLTDHLFAGHDAGDPFVLGAVAAVATRTCAIGTGVLQLALRRSAAVAKAASTLQLVSGGRFRLGVGVGEHRREFERAGVDFATRGAIVDAELDALARHWSEDDGWFSMRPRVHTPLWVGGSSTAALQRTARFADGWVGLFLDPAGLALAGRRLDAELVAVGREPGSVERRMIVMACPTDRDWSRSDVLRWAGRQFPGELGGIARHIVTGSVTECADTVRGLVAAGAGGVDLQIPHPEPLPRFLALRSALGDGPSRDAPR